MGNKSILLVDDEQTMLKALGNCLEKNKYNVIGALSGEDALIEFRSRSFDLAITDMVMAGMSGLDLLQEIKKNNSGLGVFVLTGYGDMSMAIDAFRAGADDFIIKPCDPDFLVCKVKCFFEKQDALRKIEIYEQYLPICMYCKKIRDDSGIMPGKGKWWPIEEYLCQKSGTNLTHGCCPDCFEEHIADLR